MRVRLKRTHPTDLRDRAASLDALASLLGAGLTMYNAFEEWPEAVSPELKPRLLKVARLARLGIAPERVLDAASEVLADDVQAVLAAIELGARSGVDPVPLLRRAASLARSREESTAAGRAASAGAKLSGWMVGGLPLVAVPLVPMGRAPIFDTAGLILLFLGITLTITGMVWMFRLVPRSPSTDEPIALFFDHVAAGLRSGAPLTTALDVTCAVAANELREPLARARRQAALGRAWPDALHCVDPDGLGDVRTALGRAQRLGTPPAAALEALAEGRRAAARHDFERRVRRAPVLMVLPLVLCVLPAFGFLAIVPFIRGIAFG